MWVGIWLVSAIIFAIIGGLIGSSKGRGLSGTVLGFLLGIFGLLIVAVLPVSDEVRREQDADLAEQIAGALEQQHGARVDASGLNPTEVAALRQQAVAEALSFDPSLNANDPATLARLDLAASDVERRLRLEREQARAQDRLEREQEAAKERQDAARQSAERQAIEQERRRLEAARVAAMSPTRRWLYTNPGWAGALGFGVVVVLIVSGAFAARAVQSAREHHAADVAAANERAKARAHANALAAKAAAQTALQKSWSACDPSLTKKLSGCNYTAANPWTGTLDWSWRADLKGADARRVVIINDENQPLLIHVSDLADADFGNTTLKNVMFVNLNEKDNAPLIDMKGANFVNADLTHTFLVHVDLRGANFTGALLSDVSFMQSDLRGANFRGATFDQVRVDLANFKGANLSGLRTFSAWYQKCATMGDWERPVGWPATSPKAQPACPSG